jgi:hypothetical protein
MTIRNLATVAVATDVFGAVGCVPGIAGSLVGGEPQPTEDSTVHVRNRNWSDMTMYAMRSGVRAHLGSVTSMSEATFRLPRSMISGSGDLQLVARPLGQRQAYTTQRIYIVAGQRIALRLENNLELSNFSVW